MSDKTGIAWTDATFNPWWGCTKVSPGCDHCYAERDAASFSPGVVLWGVDSTRRKFGDKHWDAPVKWNRKAEATGKRMRVFCASMADVFDKDGPESERERLWALIAATPMLDWQLLTKRVGNVRRVAPWTYWPRNVWLGISVVNQEEADRDIPKLKALPAHIRWLSIEPQLSRIDLCETFGMWWNQTMQCFEASGQAFDRSIDWVVVGGESGSRARPFDITWARSIRDQCKAAGVAFFMKQTGTDHALLYERVQKNRAGADPAEWPEDIRVREFPALTHG